MSRRKLEEIAQKQAESKKEAETCPDGVCQIDAGIGIAFRICEMAEVEIQDVRDDLFDEKITVQDALDTMKERLPDDFHRELVEEVEQTMKEEVIKAEVQEIEKAECISLIVKTRMVEQIDEMIENREKTLETVDPETDFAKGAKELVENLRHSRKALDMIKTCEAS